MKYGSTVVARKNINSVYTTGVTDGGNAIINAGGALSRTTNTNGTISYNKYVTTLDINVPMPGYVTVVKNSENNNMYRGDYYTEQGGTSLGYQAPDSTHGVYIPLIKAGTSTEQSGASTSTDGVITSNGMYTTSSSYLGFKYVKVNVPSISTLTLNDNTPHMLYPSSPSGYTRVSGKDYYKRNGTSGETTQVTFYYYTVPTVNSTPLNEDHKIYSSFPAMATTLYQDGYALAKSDAQSYGWPAWYSDDSGVVTVTRFAAPSLVLSMVRNGNYMELKNQQDGIVARLKEYDHYIGLTRAIAYKDTSGNSVYYGKLYYYNAKTSTYTLASDSDHYWYYANQNKAGSFEAWYT